MKKKIILFLVALFICNVGVFAQNDEGVPEITSIVLAGRTVMGNGGFGDYGDYCANESEGVFTWVGRLDYQSVVGGGQGFKCYTNAYTEGGVVDYYQLTSPVDQQPFESGNTYQVRYLSKAIDISGDRDYKWRPVEGKDGYFKITFNVSDVSNVTLSPIKVDETYANLGSLSVEGEDLIFVQKEDESAGFDPDVYEYNCYIPENATELGVYHFAFRNTKVKFDEVSTDPSDWNGGTKSVGLPYLTLVTASNGDVSTIEVTGFDNTSTKTYTINYKNSATGINRNDVSKVTYSVDGRSLTVAGVDAYVVYSVSGTVAADVRSNVSGKTVNLLPGVYVVKVNTAEPFKIIIK
jgi:hypothetical protein